MKKIAPLGILFLILTVTFFSGCSTKHHQRQINALQAQVGTITDELVRLDEALRETRGAIVQEENRVRELEGELEASKSRLGSLKEEESVIRGIYRTPSGFELPSINIQKALQVAGYYKGALDGKIGPATRSAIKSFQKDQGLVADGVVGRKTWSKLKVYLTGIK